MQVQEITMSYAPALVGGRKTPPPVSARPSATSPDLAHAVFRAIWADDMDICERIYALYCDQRLRVLGYACLSQGGVSSTSLDMKLLFQKAVSLRQPAGRLFIAHNHPSGNIRPSDSDYTLTRKVSNAAKLLDIQLLDHLILVPDGQFTSIQNLDATCF
jgi:DNA repair protein RadC